MDDLKNDIEKYLRGELPEGKMHALEKQALNDPFLADALEGASGIDPGDFAQDTTLLHQRLNTRINPKKIIPLWVWPARIAAGLLVIAVAAYLIINLQPNAQKSETLTYNEETPESTDRTDTLPAARDKEYLSMNEPQAKPLPAPSREPKARQEATLTHKDAPGEAPALSEPLPEADGVASEAPAPPIVTQSAPLAEEEVTAKIALPESTKEKRMASRYGYTVTDSVATGRTVVVRGRVTSSDDGTGLPGVNVVIKGSATGTVTDINGNYQVDLTDPHATLVYSFIGLESKEVPVINKPVVDVTLDPDVSQLSEVVVVGYGEGKDEDERSFTTFDMAEPAGGRRAFKKYLEDGMVYPREALDNKIEGKVTIQFTVETTGQVSNFNVLKGIGYGCDDELIRLIKEGPRWAPMKRDTEPVKGRVRVRMRFSLPKKK